MAAGATILAALASCALEPRGTQAERDALAAAGTPFRAPIEERALPELPSPAEWRPVLERALLANGELEAAWFEWSAALSRVAIAAGWPNTNLAPSFSYLVSGSGLKAWDRTTVEVGFDPMQNLALPSKTRRAGEVALDEARAAGARFAALKFRLQREVLASYFELAFAEESLRLAGEERTLLELAVGGASRGVALGAPPASIANAQLASSRRLDEIASLEAEVRARRAELNGRLARAGDAPLELPAELPEPRELGATDAQLLALGVASDPELAALAHEVAGREDALELARLAYLPDFNPFFAFTGSLERSLGVGITLPTTLPQIRARVEEAQAQVRAAQALARQTRSERGARYVATLALLRDGERRAELFRSSVLPAAEQALAALRPAYTAGSASFAELVEAERTVLDVRRTLARARVDREVRLAELEELAGLDVETLAARADALRTAREEARHE